MKLANAVAGPLLLAAVAVISAQEAGQKPSFRSGVDLVRVDVSVLNKDGSPVRGLTKADFTILEDGVPQSIEALSAVDLNSSEAHVPTWTKRASPDVATNQFQERRLIVILIDDATLINWPAGVKNAKAIGRGVVERMGPNDLAAVVFTRDGRGAQDFTADRRHLVDAIDRVTSGFLYAVPRQVPRTIRGAIPPGTKPPNPDGFWWQASVRNLTDVADALIDLPGTRKSLVYIGIGVPYDPEVAGLGGTSDRELHEQMVSVQDEMERAFARAQRANVQVYTFEATGREGLEAYARSHPYMPGKDVGLLRDYLQIVASNTGGRAIVNTDNFEPGLNQVFIENGSYYIVGFKEAKPTLPGHYRRLEVKVDRPGVDVRARNRLYVERDGGRARTSGATSALAGALPNGDMPMRATVAAFRAMADGRDKDAAAVVVAVGLPAPSTVDRDSNTVTLECRAFTPDGQARGVSRQTARFPAISADRLSLPDSGPAREALARFDLKPGRYQIRCGAESADHHALGSVYVDTEVPDFTGAPLTLSGAAIAVDPPLPTAGRDQIGAWLDTLPTTRRVFGPSARVTAAVCVYRGRASDDVVQLLATVTNDSDAVVSQQTVPVALGNTKGSSAEGRLVLPTATLKPGFYLLTLTATAGKSSVSRDVMFTIR